VVHCTPRVVAEQLVLRHRKAALRVHGTQTDARTKFGGERRGARRVPGVPAQNPSPLETVYKALTYSRFKSAFF